MTSYVNAAHKIFIKNKIKGDCESCHGINNPQRRTILASLTKIDHFLIRLYCQFKFTSSSSIAV